MSVDVNSLEAREWSDLMSRISSKDAEIASLREERDKLREYCAASARDYSGILETLESADAGILTKHFPKTIKELRETSEFMALAAEGKADHSLYEGEFAKLAAEKASLRERVRVLEEELLEAQSELCSVRDSVQY